MITGNMNNSPIRSVAAKVELYNSSTLEDTYSYRDALVSTDIERVGEESKFFGFGICQKVNVKLRDLERKINTTTDHSFKVYFSTGEDYTSNFPTFHITETHRDENTNQLSVTAYDKIERATLLTVAELGLESYTVREFAEAVAAIIDCPGIKIVGVGETETCFDTSFPEGANFEGTEDLRTALNQIAEATQTIYYLDKDDYLTFKRLDRDGESILTITKADYTTLTSGANRRLSAICSATELGDNVEASLTITGTTQYVRDNPFWDLREDIGTLVDNALAAIGGLTINQFDCSWRGNYLLEVGDKLGIVAKDNTTIVVYVLNDMISYNGGLTELTSWHFTEELAESANPTTLGEVLKQTYARVDKANKQIDLVASENNGVKAELAAIKINVGSIDSTVSDIQTNYGEAIGDLQEDIEELSTKITQTAENVKIEIKNELKEEGITSVTTNTGFTFDDEGMNVTKTDSEMSTKITEDGMTVSKKNKEVLIANNQGVKALNLHATTYLIIGNNSRFEDYRKNGEQRTGCFWIGG